MNVDRINKLADHIENLKDIHITDMQEYTTQASFSMGDYCYHCRTPACMAGHAIELFSPGGLDYAIGNFRSLKRTAADLLGLQNYTLCSSILFEPIGDYKFTSRLDEDGYISAKHAASCLRLLARTGRVDWHKAKEDIK